jgi:hypothetical protein
MSTSLPKTDYIFTVRQSLIGTLLIIFVLAVGITIITSDRGENLGDHAEIIAFAEKAVSIPTCEIAFGTYKRAGTCTDDVHGIRVMKSDRGLDFIDTEGADWKVIASVDSYQIDGRPARRIWESSPGSLERVEKAFGDLVR